MSDWFRLEECPDPVWEVLPGGRDAVDEETGQAWQYRRTQIAGHRYVHGFRHERHPGYGGAQVHAHVVDGRAGPRLTSLLVIAGDEDGLSPDTGTELGW